MKVTAKEETRPPCVAASEFKPCHWNARDGHELENEKFREDGRIYE